MSTITHVFNSHKRIESGRVVSHDFVPRMANLQYDFTGRRVLISIIPTLSPKYATLYKDTGNVLYYRGDDPDYRFELETWTDNNTIKRQIKSKLAMYLSSFPRFHLERIGNIIQCISDKVYTKNKKIW